MDTYIVRLQVMIEFLTDSSNLLCFFLYLEWSDDRDGHGHSTTLYYCIVFF